MLCSINYKSSTWINLRCSLFLEMENLGESKIVDQSEVMLN